MKELTVNEVLELGIKAHKSGQLQEANRYYTAILKSHPAHPDANHNLGVLTAGLGKMQASLSFFKKAVDVDPSIRQFWLSYIDALIKNKKSKEARNILEQANQLGMLLDETVRLKKIIEAQNRVQNVNDPPLYRIKNLIEIYRGGRSQQALTEVKKLLLRYTNSAVLYNICGAAYADLGHYDEALEKYNAALSISPYFADAHNNRGNALKNQGELDAAIEAYKAAIEANPEFFEAYKNMGNLLKDSGLIDAAIDSYKMALKIKPENVEAYNNLGATLNEKGQFDSAIESYKKAIELYPNYAEAHNNVGVAFKNKGDMNEAISSYEKAIELKPDYAEAFNNLGNAYKQKGDFDSAINYLQRALEIKPNLADAYKNLGNALQKTRFVTSRPDLSKIICDLLEYKTHVRPKDIAKSVVSLLRIEPAIKKLLSAPHVKLEKQQLNNIVSDLMKNKLLPKLMSICPIPDIDLERLLAFVRYKTLLSIYNIEPSNELLNFQSALALQCFTNEYIFPLGDKEHLALKNLEAHVENIVRKSKQPEPHHLLCLASYRTLHEYDWHDLVVSSLSIEKVFTRQILEPKREELLKQEIPLIEEITDTVSSNVRNQYEENPYPRWENLGLPGSSSSISKFLVDTQLRLVNHEILHNTAPQILIAGCGTGQHSIGTAARFRNSNVLAIDLSLTSLAYATRKCEDLGVDNIEHVQSDILDLKKLDRQFDIIESAGVLHHMKDPFEGWHILTSCLKKNGLMKIGLYSELARKDIVETRAEIAKGEIQLNQEAIRNFRSKLTTSTVNHHKSLTFSNDFYSLSSFRDLLLHVQEHRFTLPQISQYLSELGLVFCGFDDIDLIRNYKLTQGNEGDAYNLDKWCSY